MPQDCQNITKMAKKQTTVWKRLKPTLSQQVDRIRLTYTNKHKTKESKSNKKLCFTIQTI